LVALVLREGSLTIRPGFLPFELGCERDSRSAVREAERFLRVVFKGRWPFRDAIAGVETGLPDRGAVLDPGVRFRPTLGFMKPAMPVRDVDRRPTLPLPVMRPARFMPGSDLIRDGFAAAAPRFLALVDVLEAAVRDERWRSEKAPERVRR